MRWPIRPCSCQFDGSIPPPLREERCALLDTFGVFRQLLRIESLLAPRGVGISDDEAQCLLEDIGQLASKVAAVDVAFVLDLRANSSRNVARRLSERFFTQMGPFLSM